MIEFKFISPLNHHFCWLNQYLKRVESISRNCRLFARIMRLMRLQLLCQHMPQAAKVCQKPLTSSSKRQIKHDWNRTNTVISQEISLWSLSPILSRIDYNKLVYLSDLGMSNFTKPVHPTGGLAAAASATNSVKAHRTPLKCPKTSKSLTVEQLNIFGWLEHVKHVQDVKLPTGDIWCS